MYYYRPYVSVEDRRKKANKNIQNLKKKGEILQPIEIDGAIAKKFWGKLWCSHIESFSDYANRLPRGRSYAKNGSICHLEVKKGSIEAKISGTFLYDVVIKIKELSSSTWEFIKKQCGKELSSLIELLKGKISDNIMKVVTDYNNGLFPKKTDISFKCSCPDSAYMCKHIAATFYGFAHLLDSKPELLFFLRNVDVNELINTNITLPKEEASNFEGNISEIFDIELDQPNSEKKLTNRETSKLSKSEKKQSSTETSKFINNEKKLSNTKTQLANSKNQKQDQSFDIYGYQIKDLRKKLSLSAIKFSKILNVSKATIYKWESLDGVLKLKNQIKKKINKLLKA